MPCQRSAATVLLNCGRRPLVAAEAAERALRFGHRAVVVFDPDGDDMEHPVDIDARRQAWREKQGLSWSGTSKPRDHV